MKSYTVRARERRIVAALAAVVIIGGVAVSGAAASSKHKTIKLGVISAWDNPISSQEGAVGGVEAAARAINKAGGINGAKIKIISCNSLGSPNTEADCANKLVADKVAAMVGDFALFSTTTDPIFEHAGIPLIGVQANNSIDETSSDVWLLNGSLPAEYGAGYDYAAKKLGAKTMAVERLDVTGTVAQSGFMQQFASRYGVTIPVVVPIPLSAPDLSSYAEQIMSTHPAAVGIDSDPLTGIRLIQALNTLGDTNVKYIVGRGILEDSAFAKQFAAASKNVIVVSGYPTPSAHGTGVKQYISDMDAANKAGVPATEPSVRVLDIAMNAWLAVYAVKDLAAARLEGKPVTAATLHGALKTKSVIKLFDLANWAPGATGKVSGAPRTVAGNIYLMKPTAAGSLTSIGTKPFNVLSVVGG